MVFRLPPPPVGQSIDSPAFRDWFYKLRDYLYVGFSTAWSTITGTPTTLSGYGITDAQPLDADLTSIAGLTGSANQVLGKNAANNAYELKTITAGSNVTITHAANDITIASSGGGGGATLNNVISTPTTIAVDTSYPIVSYLTITDDLTVIGNVAVI